MATWKEVLRVPGKVEEVDLDAVIGDLFAGDLEFVSCVVGRIDKILSSGDMHEWAELKRLDAHAAKHQRIATDHLLNLVCLLINRLCCLQDFGSKFKDILLDRIEHFHNQCRDEVPQSVSRHKARFEYLHPYNVRSYSSIMGLAGTLLVKADEETASELAKRIASNHNHWFNLGHIVEFLKSLIDVVGNGDSAGLATEILSALGPSICLVISGMCGIRLGVSPDCPALLSQTGVTTPVWLGCVVMDLLDVSRRIVNGKTESIISACLSALASMNLGIQPGLARSVLNKVIAMLPDFAGDEEAVNCLICAIRYVDVSEWHLIELEFASKNIVHQVVLPNASERFKTLALKWLRIMCYGPLTSAKASLGALYCWKALLELDSPVFDLVAASLAPADFTRETSLTCLNALELVRLLLQRDLMALAVFPKKELVPVMELLVTSKKVEGRSVTPLAAILTKAFKLRRARKACCYILQQAVVRNATAVEQVVYGPLDEATGVVTENIARVLLDSGWEEEVDSTRCLEELDLIDFAALNREENRGLCSYSVSTLTSINCVLETEFFFKLETICEHSDAPLLVNDRIEYWLMPDSLLISLVPATKSVYHCVSARLVALLAIFESSGTLTSQLLGLVETATGVVNNDLTKDLVAIDALFLLLDSPVGGATSDLISNLEYLYALRVVAQCVDEPVNRGAMLRFIQFRWVNRFTILRSLIDAVSLVQLMQVSSLLRVVGVELMVASQLIDTDAEHVRNMRDFGSAFFSSDLARGRSCFVELMQTAFATLSVETCVPTKIVFSLGELKDPRLDKDCMDENSEILNHRALVELVDSITATVVEYSQLISESERIETVSFLIESVDLSRTSEFSKWCLFTKFIRNLYSLLSGSSLAFNLRTLKVLLEEQARCKNLLTRTGIIEAICYAVTPFVGSPDIWMIEQDSLVCKTLIDCILTFTLDMSESDMVQSESVPLALTVLESLLATRQGFASVDIVRELLRDKFSQPITKLQTQPGPVCEILNRLLDVVDKESLFKELAI